MLRRSMLFKLDMMTIILKYNNYLHGLPSDLKSAMCNESSQKASRIGEAGSKELFDVFHSYYHPLILLDVGFGISSSDEIMQ